MNKAIIFTLSHEESICVETPCSESNVYRCDNAIATFRARDGNAYVLFDDCLLPSLEIFGVLLKDSLDGTLQLHESIAPDIGYLWNEYLQDRRELPHYVGMYGGTFWVGQAYKVWGTANKYNIDTWLYTKNGKIFLEITQYYTWTFDEPEPGENYITYDEFIKNYKPYIIREIPREIIQRWYDKTEKLIRIIEANDTQYFKQKE